MNPYGDPNPRPGDDVPAADVGPSRPLVSPSAPFGYVHDPSSSSVPSAPVIPTGHSSTWRQTPPPGQASSDQAAPPLPSSGLQLPGFGLRSSFQFSPAPGSTLNPYPAPAAPSHSPSPSPDQVSVIIQSPDPHQSPLRSQCSEESCPDLECSICFSQFNNVFRCPKMLHCKHTFCLECLARINVKSTEPSAIQCPLCRSLTPLPALGLPKLTTDSDVLSYLPAAMQRVYSIRFVRNKGKLQVKRSSESEQRWGRRSMTSLRSMNRSLDVGLPSPPPGGPSQPTGMGGFLFRVTGRPLCRAALLTSVVMMMVLLTGIIIFLIVQ
ncbi:RING finger protein 223 [Mugil cephalus]|uniref:RING finger protein 223 n=1 Tax=Mugil cephalus TaxID=48193 RepID=UPI001FB6861F|nr:RING finger protein 223 [Mugil cephalus]XP_047448917.1 RING finger protein 223 [Mugil cephalus]XP_047448918.1 RING finger protein 223 [Mugil cephalus]